ncbi:P-loop containing nucleoside triphosphate hydrolase protein [Gloeophyllum trabeum ATCC 11539]|uniref:p-loop containing nucleoside triphosphate hydrolase protein n=1 Tax=Gloeophyllum trabeum (strain ATCC 11539 / FP-39264 / Madison 617) TaxID=670483 RepID=S7Q4B8_GLOTA|nr:P-loop containing nucleoside triphosphate hydrolase protein [Gloeophyllum trabeum ATCC 11539]EPQ54861.1 P-loop containing nucleoside triphosphate hydrolase protein [Gloeophyllum trabeum ATCC 11539]
MSLISTILTSTISVLLTHWLIRVYGSYTWISAARGNDIEQQNQVAANTQDNVEWSQNEESPDEQLVSDDPGESAEPEKQVSTSHYLKRDQLWSESKWLWIPFERGELPASPPRSDIHNYFYVNRRYRTISAKPTTVISDFSSILTSFLRCRKVDDMIVSPLLTNYPDRQHIGDEFFYDDVTYDLEKFFPELKKLHEELEGVQSILGSTEATADQTRDAARDVGATDAEYGHLGDDVIKQYLADVVEQVGVLLTYLDEEFQPTADRLALLLSYGQIEWDLLIYYFQPKSTYSAEQEDKIAFVLTNRYYEMSSSNPYFQLEGEGWMWDGSSYVQYSLSRTIYQYKGTKDLDALPCMSLTVELQDKLRERGRLYTSYSGMHYRTYFKDRVIVDKKAFDNTSGYIADPEFVIPELDEDKLHLLPPTVYGFNLSQKSWTSFHIEHLAPVIFDENAWDHLVLDPDTKALIKGLVEVTRNVNSTRKIISDVISGKGGGLIAVLHGPPGTGKTLTAEAVAEYLRRPLYMVGSSELPSSPSGLEYSLQGILQLATAWDAVLLIDEADSGIKYPELDQDARRIVWRKFFELAGIATNTSEQSRASSDSELVEVSPSAAESYAISSEDIEELSQKPFNGRTIKNLVRTSQALALASNERLSIEHIRVVVRASEKFLDEFANAKA